MNESFKKAVKPKKLGMKFPRSKRLGIVKVRKYQKAGPGHYGIPKRRKLNTSFSFGKSMRFPVTH